MIPLVSIRRLASVTLGKMLQTESSSPLDAQANYLRAAHVQPQGQLISFEGDQVMWFSPTERRNSSLKAGDVVIVEGGAGFGRSAVLEQDMRGWGFQNSIIRLRPKAGRAHGRFLDYCLQSALAEGVTSLVCSTATIPHFTAEKVAGFRVPAPTISAQVAIADHLDRETAKIDALIEKQRSLITGLKERRQAEVDRVIRQATGIPGTPLRQLAIIQTGITLGKTDSGSETREYPYLRVANVQVGRVDVDDMATIQLPPSIARGVMLRRGDVLMTEGGDRAALGRGSMWDGSVEPCLHQNHVFALRPRLDRLLPEYLVYLLESEGARRYFESTRRQTTNLSSTNSWLVRAFRLTLPTLKEQTRMVRSLDDANARIAMAVAKLERSIAVSQERRSALITAAVSGQSDASIAKVA